MALVRIIEPHVKKKILILAQCVCFELKAGTSELLLSDSLVHTPGGQHPQRRSRDKFEGSDEIKSRISSNLASLKLLQLHGSRAVLMICSAILWTGSTNNIWINSKRNFYQTIFVFPEDEF